MEPDNLLKTYQSLICKIYKHKTFYLYKRHLALLKIAEIDFLTDTAKRHIRKRGYARVTIDNILKARIETSLIQKVAKIFKNKYPRPYQILKERRKNERNRNKRNRVR